MRRIQSQDYESLERTINSRLRRLGRRYGIRNLYRTPQGRYRFEMKVDVDPRDHAKLRAVLREILKELPGDRSVQAKYYLPESVVARVKTLAQKKGVSQSTLVAECLSGHL